MLPAEKPEDDDVCRPSKIRRTPCLLKSGIRSRMGGELQKRGEGVSLGPSRLVNAAFSRGVFTFCAREANASFTAVSPAVPIIPLVYLGCLSEVQAEVCRRTGSLYFVYVFACSLLLKFLTPCPECLKRKISTPSAPTRTELFKSALMLTRRFLPTIMVLRKTLAWYVSRIVAQGP